MADKTNTDNISAGPILIVEDSPTQAEHLRHILERNGYQVITAQDGIEALSLMRRSRPCMVISDIIMPGMDGYLLCRQIKDDPDLQDVPVMLLTLLAETEDILKGLECGAVNFITKPYNENKLISFIRDITENNCKIKVLETGPSNCISYKGRDYCIRSDRQQELTVLLSIYETAVQKNQELLKAQKELKELNDLLEDKVEARTDALKKEIIERMHAEEEVHRLNAELEQRVARRTAQLEEVNSELEAFSHSVSHDLRAPLRIIDGFSRALQEDCSGMLDENGRKYVRIIRSTAVKMDQLIKDLLTLSRIDRQEMFITDIDMGHLARAVFEELMHTHGDRNIQLIVHAIPPVKGSMILVRQVFANLISNAIKFSRERHTAVIEVGGRSEGDENIYFVKDNGIGFDMRYAGKIFGVFQRLFNSKEYEGTGVGLSIVQRIIRRHGGRVWAEAEPDKGAAFYFTMTERQSDS